MSRRPQSLRPPARPSVINTADIAQAADETMTIEDLLRRQVLDKDRENDRLRNKISQLQAELNQRPDREKVESLQREFQDLELLLQGTQRENKRAMDELERAKQREKQLEQELAKLAGPNWQSTLDMTPSPLNSRTNLHRSNTNLSNITSPPITSGPSAAEAAEQAKQVRLLVLGMQQRLEVREEKLEQSIRRAETEAAKFEQLRREILAAPAGE